MSCVFTSNTLRFVQIFIDMGVILMGILDERRMIGSKVLHSGCVVCVECQKSIGEGAFEQVD